MKKSNMIAILFALVGIALMVLTIQWEINPVHATAATPAILLETLAGKAVIIILLLTCMPVWFPVTVIAMRLPFLEGMEHAIMVVLQGVLYFALGRFTCLVLTPPPKKG